VATYKLDHLPIGMQELAAAWEPLKDNEKLHGRLDVSGVIVLIVHSLCTVPKISLFYDELCGVIRQEILTSLPPELQSVALERMCFSAVASRACNRLGVRNFSVIV
jgi:hypothetical protein